MKKRKPTRETIDEFIPSHPIQILKRERNRTITMIAIVIGIITAMVITSCNPPKTYECVDGTKVKSLETHHKHNASVLNLYFLDLEYKVMTREIKRIGADTLYLEKEYEVNINNIHAETIAKMP